LTYYFDPYELRQFRFKGFGGVENEKSVDTAQIELLE
jgi:hypothetical protein